MPAGIAFQALPVSLSTSLARLCPFTPSLRAPAKLRFRSQEQLPLGATSLRARTHRASATASAATGEGQMAASEGLVAKHGPEDCDFCKIRDGKLPSYKILETEHALAFLDAFPMTRAHALLIPKKHYPFMEAMPAEEAAALCRELPQLARALQRATGAEGVYIAQNNGTSAGQLIFHVHFHIVPRFEGDGLVKHAPSGPMIQPEEAKEVLAAIQGAMAPSAL